MIACIAMSARPDKIKMMRQARGLTQEDLVAQSGLSLATVQRAERGENLSAGSIASLAAAFDVAASDLTAEPLTDFEPYLPLDPIVTGRQLFALLHPVSSLDFRFCELDDLEDAQVIERLYEFAISLAEAAETLVPTQQVKREIEAKGLIEQLAARGFRVGGATFSITAYDVDDDGVGLGTIYAKWDEERAALRVGRTTEEVARAHVVEGLGKYETLRGDAVVFPSNATNDDEVADWWSDPPSQGEA